MRKVVLDDAWLAFLQGRKLTEREGTYRGEQTHTHLVHVAVARLYARPAAANGPLHPAKAPGPGMGAKSGAWAGASSGAHKDCKAASASLPGGGSGADSEALAEGWGNGQGVGLGFEGLDAEALAEFGGAAEAARQLAGAPGREAARCLLAVLLGCLLAPVRYLLNLNPYLGCLLAPVRCNPYLLKGWLMGFEGLVGTPAREAARCMLAVAGLPACARPPFGTLPHTLHRYPNRHCLDWLSECADSSCWRLCSTACCRSPALPPACW